MTRALITRLATTAAILALASACTMKDQDAPPLTGPSEYAQSIQLHVSPDVLPQDGASQSIVTITARDENAQPIRNLTLRTETRVGGVPVDFGTLSARSVVTGADGRAMLVYTAPPSPAVAEDPFLIVDIVATPFGGDYNNSSLRTVAIRLVPQGPVKPPNNDGNLVPRFSISPTSPDANQTVLFDASGSQGLISDYQWNFGDGDRASGRTVSHVFDSPGTYVVTLTISDQFGRTQSLSQSVVVNATTNVPTAAIVVAPNPARVGTTLTFNGGGSRPVANAPIVSYTWDFGDGTSTTTSGPTVTKAYSTAGNFTARLFVTDALGRTSSAVSVAVSIIP